MDFGLTEAQIRWRNIARAFGYFFFGLGVILLLLIVYAMVSRLVH